MVSIFTRRVHCCFFLNVYKKNNMNRKDLLFYSNHCGFSKKIIETLVKNNIRDKFVLVCVDNKALTIPKFVNRVPMVLTAFKEIYADGSVIDYIESVIPKNVAAALDEISPLNSSQQQHYTYISKDGEGYDTNISDNNMFGILGMEQQSLSSTNGGGAGATSEKTSKMDSSLFEKYINSRKNDDDAIKKMFNPNR